MGIINNGGGGGGAISGVLVSGSAVSGQVPVATSSTAGAWTYPPGFEINYTQVTGNVNVASTTEATPTTIISPGAITFDGTAVLLTVFCPQIVTTSTVNGFSEWVLFESTTQITRLGTFLTPASASMYNAATMLYRFTPTAASHTYTIGAYTSSTTGTPSMQCGAGGTGALPPMFCRFTKV